MSTAPVDAPTPDPPDPGVPPPVALPADSARADASAPAGPPAPDTSTSTSAPPAAAATGGVRAAVITCSDSAARGEAVDTSGPLAAQLLADLGHEVAGVSVVADDTGAIVSTVRQAIAAGARVVVTTGGTGAGPRDVTPEALRSMGLRELPGLGEAIRAASRSTIPAADLSRALGGILDDAVVLALPGSPGGVRDGLAAVGGLLEHAAAVARGGAHPGHRRTTANPESLVVDSVHPTVGIDYQLTHVDLIGPEPITEAEVAAEVSRPAAGAVVTFAGVVRDHDRGRSVTALHYEGHPDAGRVLADVLSEALTRPGVLAAAARHRTGNLAIGDLAFVAAVSAAHRGEAFAACAWLVDEAKGRLPIWKHQHFADGTDEWVNSP
jgi:molybdenum cofactor synthesis domain-containing protein